MFSAFQVFSLAPFRHTDLAAPFSEILPNKVQDKCGTDAGQPPHDFFGKVTVMMGLLRATPVRITGAISSCDMEKRCHEAWALNYSSPPG